MTKKCATCKKEKLYSEFNPDKRTSTGCYGSCKECTYKKYGKDSYKKLEDWHKAYNKKNRVINRKKYKARWDLETAITAGKIKKENCLECGTNKNVEGHHPDYEKPLEVIWLCRPHHAKLHRELRSLTK